MRLFFVSLILIINLKAFSRFHPNGCTHWWRRKRRSLLSLPRSLSPTLNCAGIFQIKSRKKSKKEIKKEATPIFGAASCGKLCMCTHSTFYGTFIFVSQTCKSARLVLSVIHNRGVSEPFATSRCGSPLLFLSLQNCERLQQAFPRHF